MFLRRYERRKNGKQHTYWALVESIRTARGSRQRVAAYLGELKKSQQTGWAQLGCKLSGQKRPAALGWPYDVGLLVAYSLSTMSPSKSPHFIIAGAKPDCKAMARLN